MTEQHRQNLRFAFRDGTKEEQIFLVFLWNYRFRYHTDVNKTALLHDLSHFEFERFLKSDLSESSVLYTFVSFVVNVWLSWAAVSTTRRKAKDFIIRFEHDQKVLDRLRHLLKSGTEPSLFYESLCPAFLTYAMILSFDHGTPFPEELTEILLKLVNITISFVPILYLNHTSLNPKSRKSLFPIEVLFERQTRMDPTTFLRMDIACVTQFSSRFLHTPFFGLHSLFFRGLFSPLSDDQRSNLLILLSMNRLEDQLKTPALTLFALFPPPLILRLLVEPSPAMKLPPIQNLDFLYRLTVMVVFI
ncbi:hypothetical protein BLNAU_5157 [Blattamonas nauphoetae]|uniref:Uncharacterized protein n=1 Tax=Blattamonas nauphoetae TaxID=2049346 RepID=A0ABQ9Y8D0_9EUKA|nr:hypothetical protein BLNAU_5157 [Blattamonas nauphoetae]